MHCNREMNWAYTRRFHRNPPTEPWYFPRTKEVQKEYDEFKSTNPDVNDIVLRKFDTVEKAIRGWILVKNDFPYGFNPDIVHMVLWVHPFNTMDDDDVDEVLKSIKDIDDYCFFRNRPNVRSVETIDHFQVFLHKV